MKKRIADKKRKQCILKGLNGLNISEIKFIDGYFIYSFGKNTVCHFKVKELPNIKFGVWYLKNRLEIFACVECMIDKFKPSYADFTFDSFDDLKLKIAEGIDYSDMYSEETIMETNQEYKSFESREEYLDSLHKALTYIKSYNKNAVEAFIVDFDNVFYHSTLRVYVIPNVYDKTLTEDEWNAELDKVRDDINNIDGITCHPRNRWNTFRWSLI